MPTWVKAYCPRVHCNRHNARAFASENEEQTKDMIIQHIWAVHEEDPEWMRTDEDDFQSRMWIETYEERRRSRSPAPGRSSASTDPSIHAHCTRQTAAAIRAFEDRVNHAVRGISADLREIWGSTPTRRGSVD